MLTAAGSGYTSSIQTYRDAMIEPMVAKGLEIVRAVQSQPKSDYAYERRKMPRCLRHLPLVSGLARNLARKKEEQPSWQASASGSYNVKPTFLCAGQGQSRHWPLPCSAFPVRRSVAASAR